MSKPMKLLVLLFIVALLAAVVLTMLGKPPNLPLGPLQGMLAKEEAPVDEGGGGGDVTPVDANPCPPGQILAGSATGAATTPGTDAATGVGTGTGTGAATGTDAAAGAAGATAATPDAPATGAPSTVPTGAAVVGVSDRSWDGEARILAAGDGGSDRVADTMMVVETVPAATDPAAAGAAGAGTTGAPAAGTDAATGAPAADPAAAATTPNCIPDPNAEAGATPTTPGTGTGTGTGTAPGAGTTPTTPGAGTTPATPGAGAQPAANISTTDGANMGNSPEALRMAQDITAVMQQAKITVAVTATLVPAAGGAGAASAQKFYRSRVTGAVLVIKLTDQTAVQQWTSAGKTVQAQLVKSFIQRLGKTYPKASRSISVVDTSGKLLAVGDAGVGGGAAAGAVKLY